jgi:hypothetical protein
MKQKKLPAIADSENESDLSIDLTIYDVRASLLEELARRIIIPYYPTGVSDGTKDLILKAVAEELLFACAKEIIRENNG